MSTALNEPSDVIVVGAGIVGLTVALTVLRSGKSVRVVDRGQDPRTTFANHGLGASWSGLGARMYTRTEADVYDEFFGIDGGAAQSRVPWGPGGIDVRTGHDASHPTRADAGTGRTAADRSAEIYATTLRARPLWEQLLASLPGQDQRRHDLVFRGYSTSAAHVRAVERHRAVGDLVRVVAQPEIGPEVPALRDCRRGAIAGGLWVDGFTVDVHRVMLAMIAALRREGAHLHFGVDVERVVSSGSAAHNHLVCTRDGEALPTAHVILAVGATGNEVSRASGFGAQVTGMIGAWIAIPDLYDTQHSMKIRRPGAACEDANVTVGVHEGRPSLLVGAGYGYTGTDPTDVAPSAIRAMTKDIAALCRSLFPRAARAANLEAQIEDPTYCVRPWTTDSLPVHEVQWSASGSVHLVTGHNTGGFAMAPAIAADVAASILLSPTPAREMIGAK